MTEPRAGWHAFSPQDPDVPDDLLRLHREAPPSVTRGEVTVLVYEIAPGGSEVRVRIDGDGAGEKLSEVELIDVAIVELQLARQAFLGDEAK